MASDALQALESGIEEVRNLQSANPILPGRLPNKPLVVRAVNRASVVLLASHLERYLRDINEEATTVVNRAGREGVELPISIRLTHSKLPVDELSVMQWDNREPKLMQFVESDGWLWEPDRSGVLDHARLLLWMRSPSPKRILRMFDLWGVPDIFSAVTRRSHTRTRMWLRLEELVDKRNAIAHGDTGAQATGNDIASYISVVRSFCQRADGVMARRLAGICSQPKPW